MPWDFPYKILQESSGLCEHYQNRYMVYCHQPSSRINGVLLSSILRQMCIWCPGSGSQLCEMTETSRLSHFCSSAGPGFCVLESLVFLPPCPPALLFFPQCPPPQMRMFHWSYNKMAIKTLCFYSALQSCFCTLRALFEWHCIWFTGG